MIIRIAKIAFVHGLVHEMLGERTTFIPLHGRQEFPGIPTLFPVL